MLNRFKTALYNVVGSFDPGDGNLGSLGPGVTSGLPSSAATTVRTGVLLATGREKGLRFPYTRPHFLQLNSEDEIQVTADHAIRPIICPRDISRLPWRTGYAETINAGKSKRNEDQAVIHVGLLSRPLRLDKSQSSTGSRDQSSSSKSEPAVNGSIDEATQAKPKAQENTQLLTPPPSALLRGASPAVELREENSHLLTNADESSGEVNKDRTVDDQSEALPQPPTAISSPPPSSDCQDCQLSPDQQTESSSVSLPYYIFGVFDGHAGWGAAVSAANQLHHLIHEKLCDVIDILLPDPNDDKDSKLHSPLWAPEKEVTIDNAVAGALETAFWHMDNVISEDRLKYQLLGGCTACVALFIHGKLFVANAGDSRCIISCDGKPIPMSQDFTPETETQRIRKLGAMHPELLGGEYTHLDFIRRPVRRDLGKRVLYRDHFMNGWAYKTLTPDDLKYPLVCGEGKRSRVLATIGVTRGFGDHDLKAQYSSLPIKPFLTPEPEVKTFDISSTDLSDGDVIVLATDGLWDITSNERAVEIVVSSLAHFPAQDDDKYKYRYASAAQDLVMSSRGKLRERNWRTNDDKHATIDDISVFVIPLKPYKEEHQRWMLRNHSITGSNSRKSSVDKGVTIPCEMNKSLIVSNYNEANGEKAPCPTSTSVQTIVPAVETDIDCTAITPQEDYFKDEAHANPSAEVRLVADISLPT